MDEAARQILERRARILARPLQSTSRADDAVEVAVCTVGKELFGFPVHLLREIVPLPRVTPLPFAPDCLMGLTQVRGSLLSVFNLARLCRVRGDSQPGHLVVVEAPEGPIGFTVDRVSSCRHVSLSALSRGGSEVTGRETTLGVTEDLVVIVDVQSLCTLPEIVLT